MLELAAESGCTMLSIGFESISRETLKSVGILMINDGEAKMMTGESNLLRASQKVLAMGPKALVIKHGEYGSTIFFQEGAFGIGRHPFRAPTLPLVQRRGIFGRRIKQVPATGHPSRFFEETAIPSPAALWATSPRKAN